ncbi:MAG TPA: histidine phosphatase family protein [Thermoleophilia bacterium]|nr:histidine phosphatase family protein [Thermoleophilia bacterium]
MSLRLHFVRHGETTASLEGRFCGTTECLLTDDGRLMASYLADRCAAEGDWLGVYSSPLRRCVETAHQPAARLGLTVVPEQGLREIDHGAWDGLLEDEVLRDDPTSYGAWREHPGSSSAPGGENGYAVAARAVPVVEAIRAAHAGREGDVLVVSHKAVIRVVACALLGIDVDRYRARLACPVGSITTLEFADARDQEARLLSLADVSYLPTGLRRAPD